MAVDDFQRRVVGLALQHTRKALGTTQDEVGGVLSLSRSMVSWLETGRQELTFDQMKMLSEYWEMPLLTLAEKLGYPMDRAAPKWDEWYEQHENNRRRAVNTADAIQQNPAKAFGRTLRHKRVPPIAAQDDDTINRYSTEPRVTLSHLVSRTHVPMLQPSLP